MNSLPVQHTASDLATRELDDDHILPSLQPLSHATPLLAPNITQTFMIDEFLLSRASHNSLFEIRSELRDYLSALKAELVQLINNDYESFISLSTDLRDEGALLQQSKIPLKDIYVDIKESQSELRTVEDQIKSKLAQRAALRAEQALLHLLLKLSETVERLESLLFIGSTSFSAETNRGPLDLQLREGNRITTNKIKHLARVVAEYSQLSYLVQKAGSEKCLLVETLQPRISRIRDILLSDISNYFSITLQCKPSTEVERAKKISDTSECLALYAALGFHGEAENILRREIMSDFVKRNIFPNALVAPTSPIIPHTPLPRTPIHPGEVPVTPFTPFGAPKVDEHATFFFLLDDNTSPLANFYNNVLRFVEREFRHILLLTDRLNASDNGGTGPNKFDVLSNVIWCDLGRAIMEELGDSIFIVGKPDEFRHNYTVTQNFLSGLESIAPSGQAVTAFRSHDIYLAFERRWQLSVYFQLRWKEVVIDLEDCLASSFASIIPDSRGTDSKGFLTVQFLATYKALEKCWSEEVYLADLAWRFWRLTLQILTRHLSWLKTSIASMETEHKRASQLTVSSDFLSSDPMQDEIILRQSTILIADILNIQQRLTWLWEQQIYVLLPTIGDGTSLRVIIDAYFSDQRKVVDSPASAIIAILSRRAYDALQPLRQIPSQFRAMSSKRQPTKSSEYIPTVLRPVRTFFGIGASSEAIGSLLFETYGVEWITCVFENVISRFTSLLSTMRKNEESLRRLRKGKRAVFPLFGSGSSSVASSDDNMDEDRVRLQVMLDVEALGKDAASIGVSLEACEAFERLQMLAASRYNDGGI